MNKRIRTALISVYYKEGLAPVAEALQKLGVGIISTGGTLDYLRELGISVTPVEQLTGYPSILGGRVKTLHPGVFGGILAKRDDEQHLSEMNKHGLREIDLVIVDLYPFAQTVAETTDEDRIIEKIDIGGPSLIRAAAKNYSDVLVVAARNDYEDLIHILESGGETTQEQRRSFAARAFEVITNYDSTISRYFSGTKGNLRQLRYGENPHQQGMFRGDLEKLFIQHHGKELSYNNLVDIDAAMQLIAEFPDITFAIIKHTNACGVACRPTVFEAWKAALAADSESAFGGVLISNSLVTREAAEAINEVFFEILIAPVFESAALELLRSRKNRILLQTRSPKFEQPPEMYRSALNGVLIQSTDRGNISTWEDVGARPATPAEKEDLLFANIVCKHLKSNAIALAKNKQLIGKGCGQTSRVDALRQAIAKAQQFGFDLEGAVLASDAFFPFDDCVRLGHEAGIKAFIQPGGSVRDKDSISYCRHNDLALVMTAMRHFRH